MRLVVFLVALTLCVYLFYKLGELEGIMKSTSCMQKALEETEDGYEAIQKSVELMGKKRRVK